MRLPSSITLDVSEVSQTLNLNDYTDIDISGDSELVERIASRIIDFEKDRISSGKDIHGQSFTRYPKSYKESDQYEAFNKSANVNMALSGGMVSQIDLLEVSGATIKKGWDDPVQNAKAYNHMTGDTVTQRQFFGISNEDVENIVSEFQDEIDALRPPEEESNPLNNFLSSIRSSQFGTQEVAATAVASTITLRELFGDDES